jgi:hypothetical protein
MRVVPAVSFLLQLFAFRDFITFGTDGNRLPNPLAWTMFPLLSIGIGIGMFANHCYHIYLGSATCLTSQLVTMLIFHDWTQSKRVPEIEHWRRNTNQSVQPLEPADNDPQSWKEIL